MVLLHHISVSTPSHVCLSPSQDLHFLCHGVLCSMVWDEKWLSFVEIGGIVDHHCLNFAYIILYRFIKCILKHHETQYGICTIELLVTFPIKKFYMHKSKDHINTGYLPSGLIYQPAPPLHCPAPWCTLAPIQ